VEVLILREGVGEDLVLRCEAIVIAVAEQEGGAGGGGALSAGAVRAVQPAPQLALEVLLGERRGRVGGPAGEAAGAQDLVPSLRSPSQGARAMMPSTCSAYCWV
jgi:hypothetical protein